MIVVDTNVLSELTRRTPAAVLNWLDAQPTSEVAITAVTAAEMLYGVERLPAGRRRDELTDAVRALLDEDFAQRVEAFDMPAARAYSLVVTGRERIGRPITVADAQIAAVCRARGATLPHPTPRISRTPGVNLIDPWQIG